MTHVRTQIREEVVALVTGLPTTGSKVFQSRMRPQQASSLPCLLVTTNDEQIEIDDFGATQDRRLSLVIQGFAAASANLDAQLDQIALEVETAMPNIYPLEKIEIEFDDDLETPVGRIAMTYLVTYFTNAGEPGSIT